MIRQKGQFMKRKKLLVIGMIAACLISGCGGKKSAEKHSGQNKASNQAVTKSTDENSSEAVGGTSAKSDRIPIRTAENHPTDFNYTTIAGLSLPPKSKIAMVVQDKKSGYWKAVKEGAQQAVDELNEALGYQKKDKITLLFEAPKTANNVNEQVNLIDSILAENPAVFCLSAIDIESCKPQIETARDNDIPVIFLDSGVNYENVSTCTTDNRAAAALATEKLCDRVGNGKIALFRHRASAATSIDRLEGFNQAIAQRSDIQVVARLEENETASTLEMLKATLSVHPDLKGILATSERTGEEILEALHELSRTDIVLAGMDSGEVQMDAVKDGEEYGFVSQDPRSMGYVSVVAAVRSISHSQIDSIIYTTYVWIDQSNIEDPALENYLYS